MVNEATSVAGKAFGRQEYGKVGGSEPATPNIELILTSASVGDIAQILGGSAADHRYLGALGARLVELGSHAGLGATDDGQAYADAMRLLRKRLEQDSSSRHDLAMNPRTYGRPAGQLVTNADDWVAPMVEAEIEQLSDDDHDILRHHVIMRVGRQHNIHADFRPLLLRLATDSRTLVCLASADQGYYDDDQDANKSYILAAIAGPFVDVVMSDADDGIELEAAAWGLVQRKLAEKATSSNAQRLIQSVRAASSLLALIDTSRAMASRESQAQTHAGLATRAALAEFILSNLVLLATKPEAAATESQLDIGSFVRRDDVGRSPVDIPEGAFESWAAKRTSRRLLLDLVLVILLASHDQHDLPAMPPVSDHDPASLALDHLAEVERQGLGKMAIQAINIGWPIGEWAGAA